VAFKTFTVGEVASASDINAYLMKQTMIVCTSGTRPSSPANGWHIYETDTFKVYIYDGAAWQEMLKVAASQTWNPTWGSTGTAPVLNNGTLAGSYFRVGKMICATIAQVMGSSTTFGTGTYTWTLPTTAVATSNFRWVGGGYFRDASAGATGHFAGNGVVDQNTNLMYGIQNNAIVGQTSPFTWVSTDFLNITVAYETA
jgi:hypothetical protein